MNQKTALIKKRNSQNYLEEIFQLKNIKMVLPIISYLAFDEFLNLKYTNKYFNILLKNKKIIKHYSELGCITSKTRLLFLQSNIDINKLLSTVVKNELNQYKIKKEPYNSILKL